MSHRSLSPTRRRLVLPTASIAALAFVATSCIRFDPPPVTRIVADQAERYPQMQVQDWYKLFHQAAMGSRHLGADSSAIYNYLLHEWSTIEASDEDPLIEYISPDSQLVRLNLRPYKARNGTPAEVYRMMDRSWAMHAPSPDLLERHLAHLVFMAERGDVWINPDALAAFIEEQRARNYPAVHHSEAYEAAYAPAYRVVLRATLPPGITS